MLLVVTATVGLGLWIVLWALGIKAFDGFLITVFLVLNAVIVQLVMPILPGNRDN